MADPFSIATGVVGVVSLSVCYDRTEYSMADLFRRLGALAALRRFWRVHIFTLHTSLRLFPYFLPPCCLEPY